MEIGQLRNSLRTNLNKNKDLIILFFINLIYSSIILISFDLVWPRWRDAENYAKMAKGLEGDAPWKYRILVPTFVSLFPDSYHKYVFLALTVFSLAFSDVLLFRFLQFSGYKHVSCYFGSFVWMGSWGYGYHLYNFGLIDPVFLMCIILLFNFLNAEKYFSALISLFIGFFIKEAMFFFIPIVFVIALFAKKKGVLILTILISILLAIIIKSYYFYYDRPIIQTIIMRFEYHDIFIEEEGLLLAIVKYAYLVAIDVPISIYGIIIFTAVFGFFKTDIQNKLIFTLLCLAYLIMSLSSDFRMIFILFPIIIMLGIKPINELAETHVYEDKRIQLVFSILLLIWVVLIPINVTPVNWFFMLKNSVLVFFSIGIVVASLYLLIMKEITKLGLKDIMMNKLLSDE
ncbi:MAG: hypothetical protein ACE5KE_12435 [Methanosarcinales archaeon]